MLIQEWKVVLKHSWSLRFAAMSTVFQFLEGMLHDLDGVLPERTFLILSIVFAIVAGLARIIKQPKMRRRINAYRQSQQP